MLNSLSPFFRGSEPESCPEGEQCIENSQCASYQAQRVELLQLGNAKVWDKFNSLRNTLRSKICNSKKKKICCKCPCTQKEECPHIQELYSNAKKNMAMLRTLICNRRERTFYCCNKEITSSQEQVEYQNKEDSPTFLPSAG